MVVRCEKPLPSNYTDSKVDSNHTKWALSSLIRYLQVVSRLIRYLQVQSGAVTAGYLTFVKKEDARDVELPL
jgi:hypothetical protein